MAVVGAGTRYWAGGLDLSSALTAFAWRRGATVVDATTLADTKRRRQSLPLVDDGVEFSGFWSPGQHDEEVLPLADIDRVTQILGRSPGAGLISAETVVPASGAHETPVGNLQMFRVAGTVRAGWDFGRFIARLSGTAGAAGELRDYVAGNVADLGAPRAAERWRAIFHVFAVVPAGGAVTGTVRVLGSPDKAAFAALASPLRLDVVAAGAVAAGPGAHVVRMAADAVVPRYLGLALDVTGPGGATVEVDVGVGILDSDAEGGG